MQPISYHRTESVEDALSTMDSVGGEGRFLAGGQSLVNELKHRTVPDPVSIVDIGDLAELAYVNREDGELHIGGLTTHDEIGSSDLVADAVPVLAETVPKIADVQVRNVGTIGGNLARGDSCADYPVLLDVLDATVTARTTDDRRQIPIAEFYVDHFETALAENELVVSVSIAVPEPETSVAFRKFARRGYAGERSAGRGDLALANTAVRLDVEGGYCRRASVSVGCVAGSPVRAAAAESALEGSAVTDTDPAVVGERAAKAVDPDGHDGRVSRAYKRELVESVVTAATAACLDDARRCN
jgi:carbon-monoxide dehydrogenase medium subunit